MTETVVPNHEPNTFIDMTSIRLRDWVIIQNTGNPVVDGKEGIYLGHSGLATKTVDSDKEIPLLIVELFEPLPQQLAVLIPSSCVTKIAQSQKVTDG